MRAPNRKCKISSKYLLLRSFERQQNVLASQQKSRPDLFLLLAGLKACGSTRDLESGKKIHSDATEAGFHSTSYVMNSLVHMYAKCENMELARQIFDTMDHHTVVSWNSLILGYAANGQGSTALDLFHTMQREDGSSSPNSRTFVAVLTACSSLASREEPKVIDGKFMRLGSLEKGRTIHSQARRNGCDSDTFVSNSLIDMYSKCGSVVEARQIFDAMAHRSIVSWNSMMLGYVENGEPEPALGLFSRLERQGGGVLPDARTLVAGLMACSSLAKRSSGDSLEKVLEKGVALHSRAKQLGYESQLFVANTLIDMYSKCGNLENAKLVFDSIPARDVVSWNSLLLGFSESGGGHHQKMVLELFQRMQAEKFSPNSRTFVAVIGACSALATSQSKKKAKAREDEEAWVEEGVAIHGQAVISGCDSDLFVASSLVDMYAKCGSMELARKVFDSMPRHDTVSWNTLILGYSDNGESQFALESFARMRREGTSTPDSLTFVSALTACSSLSAMEIGRTIHADVHRYGLEAEVLVTNSLVDFYGSCGCTADAERVFYSASTTDLVTFSSIIACYSRAGDCHRVFSSFREMIEQDLRPDAMTFSSILSACSHAGLVEKGEHYFEAMSRVYRVSPDMDHYHCLIDLLGRANRIDEALELAKRMPFEPNSLTWTTLLSAATKWKNEGVGKLAFDALASSGGESSATYSLLANIFTSNKNMN